MSGRARAQLYLKCAKRDYYFQLHSAEECEMWATNVVQLANCAGHEVPGYVVMPEAQDAEHQIQVPSGPTRIEPTGEGSAWS